jgi:hypothetical protein
VRERVRVLVFSVSSACEGVSSPAVAPAANAFGPAVVTVVAGGVAIGSAVVWSLAVYRRFRSAASWAAITSSP